MRKFFYPTSRYRFLVQMTKSKFEIRGDFLIPLLCTLLCICKELGCIPQMSVLELFRVIIESLLVKWLDVPECRVNAHNFK